jgi:hypothetical protein
MVNKLPRFPRVTFALGAATGMILCLPYSTYAQTSTPQDQQAAQSRDRQGAQNDDVMRRDLARFDQFLDSHREVADQLRKTPSLVNDPQFLQNHPELNTYLQDHPSVKQQISERPDTFMSLEDRYSHDRNLRDRDAGGQGNNADRRDDANRDAGGQQDADRRGDANRGSDAVQRNYASLDEFLNGHREIAEQIRKDPSLVNNQTFVRNHPALQAYLQNNPEVRERLSEDPKGFVYHAEAENPNSNSNRDPMHDHMAQFGGFLRNHTDVQREVVRDPNVVKDHDFVQNHGELQAFLNSHPDVRAELMADPQNFVHGAQQYSTTSGSAGMSGRGTGAGATTTGTESTGTSTGTSTNPAATTHEPTTKPN